MPALPPTALPPELAAFVETGLSMTVAARGDRLVPSIAKAAACRIATDGRAATVLLFAGGAEAVCRDIARNGLVAVCMSRASTHETVQVKGRDARTVPLQPHDLAYARRSVDLLAEDLRLLGFSAAFTDALFWGRPEDLLALRFTLDGAYGQTPGPRAGSALNDPAAATALVLRR
jgi:hypothetical protein